MRAAVTCATCVAAVLAVVPAGRASSETDDHLGRDGLDPTLGRSHQLQRDLHAPLPEQFVWVAPSATEPSPRNATFRATLSLARVPQDATLYLAGPRQVQVACNGRLVAAATGSESLEGRPRTFAIPIGRALRASRNEVTVTATDGDKLAAVLLARPGDRLPAPLLATDESWVARASARAAWRPVVSLGSIESRRNLEWNADRGMHAWPGYDGISPYLARRPFDPVSVERSRLEPTRDFVLDFGREVAGRLELTSDDDAAVVATVDHGESREEMAKDPLFGNATIVVPPHGRAFGPKTAFRFARVRLARPANLRSVRADLIYYPVEQRGDFSSSDPVLNRIWETSAYTAHLSMQDRIWDAPKRDRGPWMGDLDVSARTVSLLWGDTFLLRETLDGLARSMGSPASREVNNIPGYTAAWVTAQLDHHRYHGDRGYLASVVPVLRSVTAWMAARVDDDGEVRFPAGTWLFVDWSEGLDRDGEDARRATQLEFVRAFHAAAALFAAADSPDEGRAALAMAAKLERAARKWFPAAEQRGFGDGWQMNALAILSGLASPTEAGAAWRLTLSQPPRRAITPYFGAYALEAMARLGRRAEALQWLRSYWNGMLAHGATTFWEVFDPRWPPGDPHARMPAGYHESLCHAWSSGPAWWLIEQIAGITPASPGYARASIRPELGTLSFVRGAVATPHGRLSAETRRSKDRWLVDVAVPAGCVAEVALPAAAVTVDGQRVPGLRDAEGRTRVTVSAGSHHLEADSSAR